MKFQHKGASEDDTLNFKLMLNKLLQFPHMDGEKAIEIARRALSEDVHESVQDDQVE